MPALSSHAKAIVALVMAILGILDQWFGISLGIGETQVTMIIFLLTPILVWAIPNRGQ